MDPGEFLNAASNMSNGSYSCFMYDAKQLKEITITSVSLSIVGFLLCLVTLIVIIVLKQYRSFVIRLIAYLSLAGIFEAAFTGTQLMPVYHEGNIVKVREGLSGLCGVFGFLNQVTLSQSFLLVVWIIVYLVLFTVFGYQADTWKHEVSGLVLTVGIPLIIDWLPFIHNMYGLAGPWCWIRSTNNNCNLDKYGVTYQFTLFYGPLIVLILFGSLSLLAIIVLCIRSWRHPQQTAYKQAFIVSLPFLVYSLLYIVLASVMATNRIYNVVTNGEKPFYPLWYAHTIAEPLRIVLVPVTFFLHMRTTQKIVSLRGQSNNGRREISSETRLLRESEVDSHLGSKAANKDYNTFITSIQ